MPSEQAVIRATTRAVARPICDPFILDGGPDVSTALVLWIGDTRVTVGERGIVMGEVGHGGL